MEYQRESRQEEPGREEEIAQAPIPLGQETPQEDAQDAVNPAEDREPLTADSLPDGADRSILWLAAAAALGIVAVWIVQRKRSRAEAGK